MPRKNRAPLSWKIVSVHVSNYDNKNRAVRKPIANPTWNQVQTAILSLNAGRRSDMIIQAADGASLVVGGGKGWYCTSSMPGGNMTCMQASLVGMARGDEIKEIIIGGCTTPLPARFIVDEEKTLRAARRFYEDGTLEPSLEWESC